MVARQANVFRRQDSIDDTILLTRTCMEFSIQDLSENKKIACVTDKQKNREPILIKFYFFKHPPI